MDGVNNTPIHFGDNNIGNEISIFFIGGFAGVGGNYSNICQSGFL